MNHFLLTVIVLLAGLLPRTVLAQHYIGVLGGLNISNIHVEDEDFKSVTKYGVGAVVDMRLADNFSLHVEPMYLTMGTKQDLSGSFQGATPVTIKLDQSTISVPVLLRFDILSGELRPYVMAGPFISFRLDSEFGIETAAGTFTGDAKNITKGSDFGVALGGGLSYAVGGTRLFVEGRYGLGLVDVSTAGGVQVNVGNQVQLVQVGNVDATTRSIQIMAGVAFPIGG
jgi:opacity protein-like surface antigen